MGLSQAVLSHPETLGWVGCFAQPVEDWPVSNPFVTVPALLCVGPEDAVLVVADFPTNGDYQRGLAQTYGNLGHLLDIIGRAGEASAASAGGDRKKATRVRAQMPGKIIRVSVAVGASVEAVIGESDPFRLPCRGRDLVDPYSPVSYGRVGATASGVR